MKKFKFLQCALALTVALTMAACASDEEEGNVNSLPQQATIDGFAEVYNKTMPTLFEMKATKSSASPRRVAGVNGSTPDTQKTIYMVPDSLRGSGKYSGSTQAPVGNSLSLRDLVELADVNSWTFAYNNDGTAVDSVKMSENEAREKLRPMLPESIKYLYKKGLTDANIHEMLTSCNADSTELVPLVLSLKEIEEDITAQSNMQLSAPSTGKQQPTQTTKINWEKVGNCAMEAIGMDIITALGNTALSSWTYALIFKAFKVVAKKVIGPIGAAVAVVDFALCMGRKG